MAVPSGLFIAGSDTEVGKTWFACALIRSLRQRKVHVGAYKPVASGGDDPERLWEAIGRIESLDTVCPQRFDAPLAPPLAARLVGRDVNTALLLEGAKRWVGRCDHLVVEGAGGLLSPITIEWTNADLAVQLAMPIILVVRNRLGAVNQSLLTYEAACHRGLKVKAIILSGSSEDGDRQRFEEHREMLLRQFQVTGHSLPSVVHVAFGQAELTATPFLDELLTP